MEIWKTLRELAHERRLYARQLTKEVFDNTRHDQRQLYDEFHALVLIAYRLLQMDPIGIG